LALSFVKQHGLWSDGQKEAAVGLPRRAEDHKLHTIRFSFPDQHGILRGKALVATEALSSIESGCSITTTLLAKDTSHRTVFPVFSEGGGFGMSEMQGGGDVLMFLGIEHLARIQASRLAYGQQRLVDLAIGLALEPKALILDEPAAGVPLGESSKIIEAIERLPSRIAVMMIEHDMDLVFRFARRVLVMANGRLIFQGTPNEVTKDTEVRRAHLGSYADVSRAS
jgi:ABC-type uncharacterized transport system ATPase subunit